MEPVSVQFGKSRVGKSSTLHEALTEKIEQQISSAALAVGALLPSERRLCEIHRVSRNTVRQAMRNLESKGLIARQPRKGAVVTSASAHSTKSERTNEIAFFVAREAHADATLAGLHHGMESVLDDRSYRVIALINGTRPDIERRNLEYLATSALGGAIILPSCGYDNLEAYFALLRSRVPFVLVQRKLPGIQADIVRMDDFKGSRDLTTHLLQQGHRRVAFLLGRRECSVMRARFEGYQAALGEFNLPYDPALRMEVTAEESRGAIENGYRMVKQLLHSGIAFTAINAGAAPLARGAMAALSEAGLEVGNDIALVGFENLDRWWGKDGTYTTTNASQEDLGRRAAEILIERLEGKGGKGVSVEELLPVEPIIRDSSRRPLNEMRCRRVDLPCLTI